MLHESTLGFRVKSGWAAAVLLVGPVQSPDVVDCRVINLSDPAVPESKQPYHAAVGKLEKDNDKIERRTKVVQQVTMKSVAELIQNYRDASYKIRGAGLVVGSQIDPAVIKNPHIRAHALEGRLFRTVLEDALRSQGLSCQVVVERNGCAPAATVLARSQDELKCVVSAFGRSRSGPPGARTRSWPPWWPG